MMMKNITVCPQILPVVDSMILLINCGFIEVNPDRSIGNKTGFYKPKNKYIFKQENYFK